MDASQGAQCRAQYPAPHAVDQARLLRQRDEAVGWNEFALVVPPAHQRFKAQRPGGGQIDLRLIGNEQAIVLKGSVQAVQEVRALAGFLPDFLGVDGVPARAEGAGQLDGEVGVLDRVVPALYISELREAHAHRELMADFVVDDQRVGKERAQLLRPDRPGEAKYTKGVASDACNAAGFTERFVQPMCECAQYGIAIAMAKGFIGFCKLVDINQADCVAAGRTG